MEEAVEEGVPRSPSLAEVKKCLRRHSSTGDFVAATYLAAQLSSHPGPKKEKPRPTILDRFRKKVTRSPTFQKVAFLIRDIACLANGLLLFLEAYEAVPNIWLVIGELFCFFALAIEIGIKLISNPSVLLTFWNGITVLSFIASLLYGTCGHFESVRTPIMLFRLVILLRICSVFPSSRILMISVWETRNSSVVILSFIIIFLVCAARLGSDLFESINDYWFGTPLDSLYTSFVIVSQSGWLPAYHDVESESRIAAKLYFLVVSFLGSFIMLNALNGVSSQSMETARVYRNEEKALRKKLEKAEQVTSRITHKVRKCVTFVQRDKGQLRQRRLLARLERELEEAKQFREVLERAKSNIPESHDVK